MDNRVIKLFMKNLLNLLFCVFMFSCSSQKSNTLSNTYTLNSSNTSRLAEIEINIIDDFISTELKKDRYKNYKNSELFLIEEALKNRQSIDTYLYSKNEWASMNKINKLDDATNRYFLNDFLIKKIKLELEKETIYYWKISDIKNTEVTLLKHEELRNTTNNNAYSNFSNRIIIFLSRPLIIDEDHSFISFEIGDGRLGFQSINHFTVLMRKINNHWKQIDYYYDGVYN